MQSIPQYSIPIPILEESKNILDEFPLCDSCLGRLFVKNLNLSSSKILGKKIKSNLNYNKTQKCFVCKDLLDNLQYYVKQLQNISDNVHFSSFLIGTILKPSVMDRDDLLRSRLQKRGIDSIKNEITKSLTKSFSRKSKKILDNQDPDLTFLVNFRTDICEQRSKSLLVSGRYTKSKRGLPQKQKPCSDCEGKGCIFCNNHGMVEFDSVEGVIAQFFYKKFGSPQVKFTWIGGEDKNSLVTGNGRLFFSRIINPAKRNSRIGKHVNLGTVTLNELHKVSSIPITPIKFISDVSIQVKVNSISISKLKKLVELINNSIVISERSKTIERRIYELNYKKLSSKLFFVRIVADGGISIKKLVESDNITPNISSLLGTKCTCVQFDFNNIQINDNN